MEIKNKKHFSEIIKSLTEEILDEEELDEMTVTGNVAGYNTPFAFSDGGKKDKKKKKKMVKNSTGFIPVNEALNEKDLKQVTKLIREVVANILRDIWLKRTAWK